MGQASSSIIYQGSTCAQTDPRTGLCVGDVFFADESNTAGGGGFPGPDAGEAQAVADWAASQRQQSDTDAVNNAWLVLAQSFNSGNIPSPIPGLGLNVPMKTTTRNWLLIGGAALVAVLVLKK